MDVPYFNGLLSIDQSTLGQHWSRISFYSKFSTNQQSWANWVFEQITPYINIAGTSVLDLGSGNGSIWARNLGSIPIGLKLFLSDLSLGMVHDLRAIDVKSSGVVCCDARLLPFVSNYFDTVCAFNVFYHVDSRHQAYKDIRRVLKSSGVFVITTIAADHLAELRTLVSSIDEEMGENLVPSAYSLERAQIELLNAFSHVTTLTYRDLLCVTSAEDLIHYLLSTNACRDLRGEPLRRLTETIKKTFSSRPVFQITASSGLIIARKAS